MVSAPIEKLLCWFSDGLPKNKRQNGRSVAAAVYRRRAAVNVIASAAAGA